MNLIELLRDADRKLDTGEITIGEYEKMIAPLKDAVPVVRCKDCKFYHRMTAETGICVFACRHLGNDGFCSEGERKDGEQDG